MRNAFAEAVTYLAEDNKKLILLSGDIGNRLFDEFKQKYPDRFYNCGVAEAGMIGLAAGLASSGFQPITYTIAPFTTLRCLEQIRLDVCYANLPVVIVGTGSGLSYSNLGPSHHSMEDIACLRTLPNMSIVCPADAVEVKLSLPPILRRKSPTYIRLGKKGEPRVHLSDPPLRIGRAIVLERGKGVALIGVGTMLHVAIECAGLLREKNISPTIVSLHTVKPLDTDLLTELFATHEKIVVLEEHGMAGGVGSAVLEWSATTDVDSNKLLSIGVADTFLSAYETSAEARVEAGLDPNQVTNRILAERSG